MVKLAVKCSQCGKTLGFYVGEGVRLAPPGEALWVICHGCYKKARRVVKHHRMPDGKPVAIAPP